MKLCFEMLVAYMQTYSVCVLEFLIWWAKNCALCKGEKLRLSYIVLCLLFKSDFLLIIFTFTILFYCSWDEVKLRVGIQISLTLRLSVSLFSGCMCEFIYWMMCRDCKDRDTIFLQNITSLYPIIRSWSEWLHAGLKWYTPVCGRTDSSDVCGSIITTKAIRTLQFLINSDDTTDVCFLFWK